MKYLIGILITFLTAAVSFGGDPVQRFVHDLLRERSENIWMSDDDSVPVPKGGYIYRFELEMAGDGQSLTFVASSLDANRKGESWSVYRKGKKGDYVKIRNLYFMGGDLRMRLVKGVRRYSFYVPLKRQEGGSYFGYFWLDASGAWHDQTHELTDEEQHMVDGDDRSVLAKNGLPDEAAIAKKLKLGAPVAIKIQKVLLAKYIQHANIAFRALNVSYTLSQQYLDPVDAADIASVAKWRPPPAVLREK